MRMGDEFSPSPALAGEVPLVFQRGDGGAGSCPPLSVRACLGAQGVRAPIAYAPLRHFPHKWRKEKSLPPTFEYKLENTL